MNQPTDPRIRQLAEARYRNGYGAWAADAWDNLDPSLRQHLTNEAAAWLTAAIAAGLMPPAERPSPKHNAVWIDDEGFLQQPRQPAPRGEVMTEEEYEERKRRLEEDIEDARKAFVNARSRYDQLCEDARELRYQWRKQQKTADRTTEK